MARRRRAAATAVWCRGWVVSLALAWLGAHPAGATSTSTGSVLAPSTGDTLVAGSSHVVRWSPLPAGVDEFELLLSLDDGASFPVRLTPQLDPATSTYLWRVPDLPARAARIRLRWGIDGREIDGPAGPPFSISAKTWRTSSGLSWRHGEWWLTAHPNLVGLTPEQHSLRTGSGPNVAPPPLGSPQRGPWDPCPTRVEIRSSTSTGAVAALSPGRSEPARHPRFFPMRC